MNIYYVLKDVSKEIYVTYGALLISHSLYAFFTYMEKMEKIWFAQDLNPQLCLNNEVFTTKTRHVSSYHSENKNKQIQMLLM